MNLLLRRTTRFYSHISKLSKSKIEYLRDNVTAGSDGLMQEYLTHYLYDPHDASAVTWKGIVIAYYRRNPIGWCYMTQYDKIGMYVIPNHRNKGMGSRMVKLLIQKTGVDFSKVSGYPGIGETLYSMGTGLRVVNRVKKELKSNV